MFLLLVVVLSSLLISFTLPVVVSAAVIVEPLEVAMVELELFMELLEVNAVL